MTGKSYAIAKAAANAGFDTSNVEKLAALIDAIRDADRSIYPDYYTGSAKYKDSLYPDSWVAAKLRERKGVTQMYRDFNTMPSVPAFVISSREILKNLNCHTNTSYQRPPASGANREPLASVTPMKRPWNENISGHTQQRKRAKAKIEPKVVSTFSNGKVVIDLTGSDLPNPLFSANKPVKEQGRDKSLIPERTKDTFNNVISSLQATKAEILMNRETLRKQWEFDRNLQLQIVTADLQVLNRIFVEMQNQAQSAIDLIEQRLI